MAEWLWSQLEAPQSTLMENIRCIQRDALSRQIQSFYQEFPSATFDSLVQLIHSGMTAQQRSDLLAALVSLEGQSAPASNSLASATTGEPTEGGDAGSGDETPAEEI